MELIITIDDEYSSLANEPTMQKAIQQSATLILMAEVEKRRLSNCWHDGYTGNANLPSNVLVEPTKPEPDALQTFVEANRRDDKAISIRNTEVERLLEKK